MQSELHRNNVYQSVELLLLVPMIFLLAIPKCLLIFKEIFITLVDLTGLMYVNVSVAQRLPLLVHEWS